MRMFQPPPPPAGMFQPPAAGAGPPGHVPPGVGHLSPGVSSSPFYQMPPSQAAMDRVAGPPSAATATASTPMDTSSLAVDWSIRVPPRLLRFSTGKITNTAAAATKIPLGAVLRPLAPAGEDEALPTIQPGNAGIVRCAKCRTYINALVHWSDHGRRWTCNICGKPNDCPSAYFCHLDEAGYRRDRLERPELSRAAVEFLAPAEYMVRPPQEPAFFFCFDVSAQAVRSGVLSAAATALKQCLDQLPGGNRTKIGFITYDHAVHYYNLDPKLKNPQMLVVADLKELFVPLPDHLLVSLDESRHVVETFLDALPEMFKANAANEPQHQQPPSCLGPALKAAFTVMKNIGGKMSVFQSVLPNLGDGALKPREQANLMGTPAEIKLLLPDNTWYKDTAVEFSRAQISVDLYLFPRSYMDVATLAELPKLTSGSLFSHVAFDAARDGARLAAQLTQCLCQETAWEAVMRIRCTKGMRLVNFHGNFYMRGSDLMALPNCTAQSVFGFDLAHDEPSLTMSHVTIQAALLYTSGTGERRIRVMTQALPVTSLLSEVVASIDVPAATALLAKQAVNTALKTNLENARSKLQQAAIEVMRAAAQGDKRTVSGYAVPPQQQQQQVQAPEVKIPPHLALFPLYTLALMKHVALRGGTDVHPDERAHAQFQLQQSWVEPEFVYPRMYSLADLPAGAGRPANEGDDKVAGRRRILLPRVVPLSADHLHSSGLFLLDNGVDLYLWVGRQVDMGIMSSLFDVHSLDDLDPNTVSVIDVFGRFVKVFYSFFCVLDSSFHQWR
jgi:protein transport protein SEC24